MIVDSNIIIYASRLDNIELLNFIRKNETDLKVSIITKIEVLGYHKLNKVEKLFFENFFNAIQLVTVE